MNFSQGCMTSRQEGRNGDIQLSRASHAAVRDNYEQSKANQDPTQMPNQDLFKYKYVIALQDFRA